MLWRLKVLFVYRKISNYSKISDYGTSRNVESKYLSVKYLLHIIKHWHPSLSRSKIDFWGSIWGGPWWGGTPNYVKISVCYISADIKTRLAPKLSYSKNWFLGVHLGGSPGGWHPQTMSKYLSVKYLLISKKVELYLEPFKKLIFWGPILGGFRGMVPPNYVKIFVC